MSSLGLMPDRRQEPKWSCEITIISFSRSICLGGLAALIGVTGKPYPSCLSCHSHPIRPFRAPSPRGEGCDTRIPSSKKRRRSRHLNPEPNESKVKRSCEEMRIHFFTAPFLWGIDLWGEGDGLFLLIVSMLRASSKDLHRLFPPLHTHLRRQRPCAGSGYRLLFRRIRRGDGSSHRHRRPWY